MEGIIDFFFGAFGNYAPLVILGVIGLIFALIFLLPKFL